MVLVRRRAGGAGKGNQAVDLVGLAAEAEQKDGGEVGVGGVAGEDAAEEVGGFAVFGHAAAGAVRDGDDAIDIRIGAEDLRGEVRGDAAGDRGGAVDRREDADVVAGGDAAVGADDSLKGSRMGRIEEFGRAGLGADRIIALKVTGDEIVGMNVFAGGDRVRRETNDLIEFADRLTGLDGMQCYLVASRNLVERSDDSGREGTCLPATGWRATATSSELPRMSILDIDFLFLGKRS